MIGPITGLAFFLIDRQRSFVRFHAIQSIGLTVVWVALVVAFLILSTVPGVIPVLGFLVSLLLNLGLAVVGFGHWVWLMFQAVRVEGSRFDDPSRGSLRTRSRR